MSKAWMPFYGGDFFGNTLDLSAEEIGAYTCLIWHYWEHGGLPADNRKLCRIARVHPPRWSRVRNAIEHLFVHQDGGLWRHKRLDQELIKNNEISNKRSAAALQMHSKSSASAVHLHTQSQSQSQEKPKKVSLSMPADFEPDREFPKARGWANERIDSEVQRFRDHASMNGRTCKNWQAAWRNWVTSPYQQGNGNGARPLQDDSKSVSKAAKRLAEAAERGEFSFGPKPSLLLAAGLDPRKLLPKG